MAELMPCPFCGEVPVLIREQEIVGISCCDDSGLCVAFPPDREESAIAAWNRRHTPANADAKDAEIAKLRDILRTRPDRLEIRMSLNNYHCAEAVSLHELKTERVSGMIGKLLGERMYAHIAAAIAAQANQPGDESSAPPESN
jgi:Lar family restriction alleviation protein